MESLLTFCRKFAEICTKLLLIALGKGVKIQRKVAAKFGRNFRASFAVENRQKHFPPNFHCKFHDHTSLRGSGCGVP